MTHNGTTSSSEPIRRVPALFAAAALILAFLTLAPSAKASKQVVDFFGGNGNLGGQFTRSNGVAVNQTGAGAGGKGDIYAVDPGDFQPVSGPGANRIHRFSRDDNGTPADPSDDTFHFVSTWGAGVDSSIGGSDYQVCTVAADCQAGLRVGGNGTMAGNGSLTNPSAIAVDSDTGEVYVSDNGGRGSVGGYDGAGNFRVNVYSGDGTFLRSFGWDVVESGPDDNGAGYEICKAGLDICKAGLPGAGLGQIGGAPGDVEHQVAEGIALSPPDGNPATGTVFLADTENRRINTYSLDGSSPGSFGSAATFASRQPQGIAVDSRGIVYASNSNNSNQIERYDTQNANGTGVGFLAPLAAGVDEVQTVTIGATSGSFTLTFNGDTTADLPFNVSASDLRIALLALSSVGGGSVEVNGGPGNASGSSPYTISFHSALGARDLPQLVASDGATPLSGGAGASVATTIPGQAGLIPAPGAGLAVDPDSDGPGPDADVLYALRSGGNSSVQQFGPLNAPGLVAPPTAEDDRHATSPALNSGESLAIDEPTGLLYASANQLNNGNGAGTGIYVLGDANAEAPTATLDSLSGATTHSVAVHATIDPNGPPDTSYHFEYRADGDADWTSTPTVVLGHQESPQPVDLALDPPPIGLHANTLYHVRLVVQRRFASPITATPSELTFTTDPAPPLVETTGTPIRTTTSAQLQARVNPNNSTATYHFEYGDQGPCEANPCASTPTMPAGSGDEAKLVVEGLDGLNPNTTYHYRVVADNGVGGPVKGADMTVTTRASEAPLSHGHFPGPPGSDRAWEQVSLPESGGNPVLTAYGFSDQGDRALYQVLGGTPLSESGNVTAIYFAERGSSGWQTRLITPPRAELHGAAWNIAGIADDLSTLVAANTTFSSHNETVLWRLRSGAQPNKLFDPASPQEIAPVNGYVGVSADQTRVIARLIGGILDPAYPTASAKANFYDVSDGPPKLISLLPGNEVSACGVTDLVENGLNYVTPQQPFHWVSAGGSLAVFASRGNKCAGTLQLYLRDIDAEQTKALSTPVLSGPECNAGLIKVTPDAVFLITKNRLVNEDTEASSCPSNEGSKDIYRYEISTGTLDCLTCFAPGSDTDVVGSGPPEMAVSEDGSRIYFASRARLVQGAASGQSSIYRLNANTGDLAFVAAGTMGESTVFSDDGRLFFFTSDSPAVEPLGGSGNGGTNQIYRYDDDDRSLTCVSCPQDGTEPLGAARLKAVGFDTAGNNLTSLAEDGTFAFSTPTSLVGADQNTPALGGPEGGTDIYEWRDGRQLLVTDGLTNWVPQSAPYVTGISPSGRDIYFVAFAQYTPDALDSYGRLYDARIGGGFTFPPPPKPCPLEVCQGTPQGAPEEPPPGSSDFRGAGNQQAEGAKKCSKGRARRHGKCVQKQRKHKRAHRRASGQAGRGSR